MGNSPGKQTNRTAKLNGMPRAKSRIILSPREWKERGLLKRSKSQPLPPVSTPKRTFTKKFDKRPVDPEDEDEDYDENDVLSDEYEFIPSTHEEPPRIVYNDGIKLLPKQRLLLLQIELIRSTQDMCDVTLPVAAILLHHFKWDKEKLIEKWIEGNEDLCKLCGVFLPLTSKKEDSTIIDDLFLSFKEEVRPTPLLPSTDHSTQDNVVHNLRGGHSLLDLLRPFLVHRGLANTENEEDGATNLNPLFLINSGLSSSHSTYYSSYADPQQRGRRGETDSPVPPPRRRDVILPLPPASPLISRRAAPALPHSPSIEDMELAAVQLSLISQVQELFPEVDEAFVVACLREYRNNYELVVDNILEENLPPHLSDRLKILRGGDNHAVPSNSTNADLHQSTSNGINIGDENTDTLEIEHTYMEEGYEYQDGASTNVVSDPQYHSTVGEDFSENPNAWFTATHTEEVENESLDCTSVTSMNHTNYNNGVDGSLQLQLLPTSLHEETEDTLYVDNYTMTSEHTSIKDVFDNDNTSEDEEELVVRRKMKRSGASYDRSESIDNDNDNDMDNNDNDNDIMSDEDKGDMWMVCEPMPELLYTDDNTDNNDINNVNTNCDVYVPQEDDEEFCIHIDEEVYSNNNDEQTLQHQQQLLIQDEDTTNNYEDNINNDDVINATDGAIDDDNLFNYGVEIANEFEDIDLCMQGIVDGLVVDSIDIQENIVYQEATAATDRNVPDEAQAEKEEDLFTCLVCYTEATASETYCLACKHVFCMDCWRSHLITKLGEGLVSALSAACMNPHCKLVVDVTSWRRVLDEVNYLKYQWFFLKSFVDNSPKAVWCSNPVSCGNAAYYNGVDIPSVLDVKCECGWKFCFHCSEESHQPSSCSQLSNWQALRSGEEGQNALWLSQNTKRCPACKVHIEKNEGCMHLSCKVCAYEFCWLCKGAWAEHGDKTGGYYSCNRYDPLRHDTPDLDMRFGKYVHHFQRYTYHTNARKVAENRRPDITTKEPANIPGDEPWDRAFLYDVLELVISCRNVLKYTYVFGYYLEETKEKELFEFLQEDLEKSTEHLTELMYREIDHISAPIAERDGIVLIKNSIKVTRKFLDNLLAGIQNGLIAEYGPPSDAGLAQKGKKLKDRKISRLLTRSR